MRIALVLAALSVRVAFAAEPAGPWLVAASDTPLTADGAEVGTLARGCPIDAATTGEDATVAAHVPGALEVWASVPRRSLGVMVCSAQSLPGQPVHLSRGDVVELAGVTADRAKVRAVVHPGFNSPTALTYDGELPVAALCRAPTPRVETGTLVSTKPDRPIPIRSAPGGAVIYTLPANEFGIVVRRTARRRGFSRVLVADAGPALEGWIDDRLLPVGAIDGGVARGDAGLPQALGDASWPKHEPLHELASGTEIVVHGHRIAKLRAQGWARVTAHKDDLAAVSVAVDDEALVSGWVTARALGPRVDAH